MLGGGISTPLSIYSSQTCRRIHKALTSASFAFFAAGRMQIYPSIHLSVKQPIYSYIDVPIYLFIPILPTNTQSPHQCLLRLLCRWQNADLSIHPSICQTAHLFIHRRPYLSIHPNLSDEYTKPSPVPPSPSLPMVECRAGEYLHRTRASCPGRVRRLGRQSARLHGCSWHRPTKRSTI